MANFRPLYDRVLVKRIEAEERSAGGLVIPDTAKEKPQQAEVVAVGRGRRLKDGRVLELQVKPGDRVLFGKYSGDEIKLDGATHLILREDDILAVLN
jgi:chaperonin GroES